MCYDKYESKSPRHICLTPAAATVATPSPCRLPIAMTSESSSTLIPPCLPSNRNDNIITGTRPLDLDKQVLLFLLFLVFSLAAVVQIQILRIAAIRETRIHFTAATVNHFLFIACRSKAAAGRPRVRNWPCIIVFSPEKWKRVRAYPWAVKQSFRGTTTKHKPNANVKYSSRANIYNIIIRRTQPDHLFPSPL